MGFFIAEFGVILKMRALSLVVVMPPPTMHWRVVKSSFQTHFWLQLYTQESNGMIVTTRNRYSHLTRAADSAKIALFTLNTVEIGR